MTSHDPATALVARLEAAGLDLHPTGPDAWASRCPAHNGEPRNLSIKRGDGRALIHCHAHGCAAGDVVSALEMNLADLFPPRDGYATRLNVKGSGRAGSKVNARPHATPEAAIEATARRLGQPTARWTYHEADGTETARVHRFDPPGERKQFRPVHSSPDGWTLGDPPGPWPLYRLPDLAAAGRVFVTEGEKAADLAARLGVRATTSAHGAKSAHKTDWGPLAGREVLILPDSDIEGEAYARAVLAELSALSPRPTVRVVRLPDLWRTTENIPEGADIEEWLTIGTPEGWTDEDSRAELERVADVAPPVESDIAPVAADRSDPDVVTIGPTWPEPPEAAAFDGLAGEIVQLVEPHSEADPVAILAQVLVGFGNLIGRSAYFAVEADRHHANEFIALVGDTAKGRKGTSWGHARRFLEAVDPAWATDRIQPGLVTGAGLKHAVRDPVMKREPVRDQQTKRIIDYEEIPTDPGEPDKRLLCMESELGGTLRVAARDGNDLSAVIRQSWDSGDLRNMTRTDPLKVTGGHISIVGHITRDELASVLTQTEAANGFANRFLWLAVRRSKLLPFGGSLDETDCAFLIQPLRDAAEFARTAGRMDRDSDANALWAEAYAELSEGRPGLLGAVTSRAEAHTMRLAMLYALIDCSPVIRAAHLRSALALWRYAERSAAFIFGDSLGDPDADSLREALGAAGPDGLTRTDIRDTVFHRHKSAKQVARLLSKLAAAGLAYARTEATGGRPAERWFAVSDPAPSARTSGLSTL